MAEVFLNGQAQKVGNIYCIGRNYAAHIEELNNQTPDEMVVFMKPSGSINSSGIIRLPAFSREVHHECELVLLIGSDSDGLNRADGWRQRVAGYAVGLDLTARDVQSRLKSQALPWLKAKGFKGSACVSEFVAADRIADPQACRFALAVNGRLRQQGDTALMLHPVDKMLAEIDRLYGLQQGDLIFSGTPAGVAELKSGDVLEMTLENLVAARFEVV